MSQNFEQFGKYILFEKLAAGGMAEVFLAKSPGANGVNKFVAIKRILPQYSDNTEFIDMFKEEAKIAINLNHSNVVPIYEFGVEKKQFYLVMEYVEGRNLRQIINELKKKTLQFSIEQIVFMIKEVAAGLDHAHRCIDGSTGKPLNITHRDMSPQNVMVSFEGEVKVIDFGIAKAETQAEATRAGTLKGKFGYMSPEQADGQPIDMRTDIFSVGIVLWELLASDRLFTSNSEASILRKIRECQIPSIRKINLSVPPELERIVNKALAKDKSLRYQTASALHKDLNRFLNTEYPDFSPHDFSVFVKNAFTEIYTDSRKKLITYASIQGKTEEKTAVTQTMTYTGTGEDSTTVTGLQPPPFDDGSGDDNENEQSSSSLTLSQTSVEKVNLDDLKGIKNGYRGGITNSGATPARGSWNHTQVTNSRRAPQGTAIRKLPAKESSSMWVNLAMVVFLLVGGGWIFTSGMYRKFLPANTVAVKPNGIPLPPKVVQVAPSTTQAPPAPTEGVTESASTSEYRVTINSEPMGARISINGEFTNSYTPSQMTFKAFDEIRLKLEKGNDYEYESMIKIDRDAMTISPTLVRRLWGYLTVKVIHGGANPRVDITINGVPQPPITDLQLLKGYRVPAGVPIVVKASNPYVRSWATKTVTIQENKTEKVELILTQ